MCACLSYFPLKRAGRTHVHGHFCTDRGPERAQTVHGVLHAPDRKPAVCCTVTECPRVRVTSRSTLCPTESFSTCGGWCQGTYTHTCQTQPLSRIRLLPSARERRSDMVLCTGGISAPHAPDGRGEHLLSRALYAVFLTRSCRGISSAPLALNSSASPRSPSPSEKHLYLTDTHGSR